MQNSGRSPNKPVIGCLWAAIILFIGAIVLSRLGGSVASRNVDRDQGPTKAEQHVIERAIRANLATTQSVINGRTGVPYIHGYGVDCSFTGDEERCDVSVSVDTDLVASEQDRDAMGQVFLRAAQAARDHSYAQARVHLELIDLAGNTLWSDFDQGKTGTTT